MAQGKPEQITQDERSASYRKWLKRIMRRKSRREEKKDPENANVRDEYNGYSM